jgi:hypothetical protein
MKIWLVPANKPLRPAEVVLEVQGTLVLVIKERKSLSVMDQHLLTSSGSEVYKNLEDVVP